MVDMPLACEDYTIVLWGAFTVERGDEDDETGDTCTGLFLVGGVADGLEWM
jgi:hypothetical protein